MILLAGCISNAKARDLTEDEAKKIVKEKHFTEHGNVEIISVCDKSDKYVIEWKVRLIEHGKDSVMKEDGTLKEVSSSRGSCKWK